MNEITTSKIVKTSGSSLAVYLTRELTMLGLNKGDAVEITLKKFKN